MKPLQNIKKQKIGETVVWIWVSIIKMSFERFWPENLESQAYSFYEKNFLEPTNAFRHNKDLYILLRTSCLYWKKQIKEFHTHCFSHCRAKSRNLLRCWISLKPERDSLQIGSKHAIWGNQDFKESPYRCLVALWAVLRLGSFGTVTFDNCIYKYIK